jgi:hypothetical protein
VPAFVTLLAFLGVIVALPLGLYALAQWAPPYGSLLAGVFAGAMFLLVVDAVDEADRRCEDLDL